MQGCLQMPASSFCFQAALWWRNTGIMIALKSDPNSNHNLIPGFNPNTDHGMWWGNPGIIIAVRYDSIWQPRYYLSPF